MCVNYNSKELPFNVFGFLKTNPIRSGLRWENCIYLRSFFYKYC